MGTTAKQGKSRPATTKAKASPTPSPELETASTASSDKFDTNFPLRRDFMIKLNLPSDLKSDEVKRMAYYLLTLCQDFNPEPQFGLKEPLP